MTVAKYVVYTLLQLNHFLETIMKDQICEMARTQDSRTFKSTLQCNKEMASYVRAITDTFQTANPNESIYCIVHGITPEICECGNRKPFNSFNKGYKTYCSLSCPAKAKKHSETIKEVWKDEEKLASMLVNKNQSMIKEHGTINPMHNEELKQKCMQSKAANKAESNQLIEHP